MPEENFEQQARKLAEPFSMEPKPAVWQNIKAAIAPKRRRRTLLWWWLLPLCVVGGVAVYVLKDSSSKKNSNASTVVITPILKDTFSSESQIHKREDNNLQNEEITSKIDKHTHLTKERLSENTTEEKQKISLSQTRQYQSFSNTKQEEKRNRIESDAHVAKPGIKENKDFVEASPLAANTKKERDSQSVDSLRIPQPEEEDGEQRKDTATENVETTSASADSAKTIDKTPPVAKKKANKKSFSIGVLAEVGKASLNSPLSESDEKSSQVFPAALSSDYFGLTSGTVTKYKLSNGVDAAIGISAQKQLSNAFSFTAQLTYRYQQFGVAQTVFIDTTTGGNGSPSNGSSGSGRGIYYPVSAVQRLHLATFYTGVGWQFFSRKHWGASVGAGIDNSFLLSITQKQNGSADSVKSLQTKSFYRWQPSLQFALPIDIYLAKKTRLELSPFVRFGVRRFQKSNASYEGNRLSSAGIQAIYFFK